ncbi:MFS-type transporter SLC18B1-like [Montipora capricornis]|uniref:MFS-type transporter SLC18B1-like n=1 Tax=Montipora capricornis TaxID=246305 RepID=UPI0035F1059A
MEASSVHSFWTIRKILILVSLLLVYVFTFSAITLYLPFFPSEARDKGVSETVVGFIFGTYPFVIFVSSPLFGHLIPKYNDAFVLFTGIAVFSGSQILFGFSGMISDETVFAVVCFALRATSGMGGAAAETSAISIIMEQFPKNVGSITGAVETFVGIGHCLGPVLGGFLYEVGDFKLPFIVMGSVTLAVLPLLMIALHKRDRENSEESLRQSISILETLRIPGIFMLSLCSVTIGLSFSYIDAILEPYLKKLGQSPAMIGLMFFLYSGVYALLAPVIGWIGDKKECYRGMLLIGFTSYAVGFFLLGPAPFLTFLPPNYQDWLTEFQEVSDKRLLWDLIKYKIRQCTISFCKTKARDRRNKLTDLEKKLKESEELCACNPTEQNVLQLEELKSEYDSEYDYITRGNIIRSKANCNLLLVCISLTICGLSGGLCFVPIIPEFIRTARENGIPDNSCTNALLSSIYLSVYFMGETIGPFIAAVCDEYFGFQWAMSVAGFICISQAFLLLVFTFYEYMFPRNVADCGTLKEDEKRKLMSSN